MTSLCQPCARYQVDSVERIDKIIGYTNRPYGYNHYSPIPIGSPVYEDKKGYYILHTLISKNVVHRQYFYRDSKFTEHFNR